MTESMLLSAQKCCFEEIFHIRQGTKSQKGLVGYASQQGDTPGLHHGLAHVMFGLFVLVGSYLVDNDPGNADIVMLTKDPIQFKFIKGTPESTVGDQYHVGSNQGGNFGIVNAHDTSHGTVSRSFAQDNVASLCNVFHGGENIIHLTTNGNFSIDVTFGVSRRYDNRTHGVVINVIQMKVFLDETHIFIHAQSIAGTRFDFDMLLSHGFDEPHLFESFLQSRHDGQTGGGLSDVLSCGGDKDGSLVMSTANVLPKSTAIGKGFPRLLFPVATPRETWSRGVVSSSITAVSAKGRHGL
mmetsp:Transcript_12757/g.24258  ORF Transcript_12757/g.24258 Transcript_12757/m.24258 type:complete len:297 (+) Transcript_12757:568-1458(+)